MLLVGAALGGYVIEATDGCIGTVKDILFDDRSWSVRWMVVDTGNWLPGRKVLLHPSAIGAPDHVRRTVPVRLTMARIKESPDLLCDAPVSRQMEERLHGYYGWDPLWGRDTWFDGYGGPYGRQSSRLRNQEAADYLVAEGFPLQPADGDPDLRSLTEVNGYHIHAVDGMIGHVENFLVDEASWTIRYLIVDTRNWWPGQHVLLSPFAVREISWSNQEIRLDLTRERIKASPPWDPVKLIDAAYEIKLHGHYDWPGYGW